MKGARVIVDRCLFSGARRANGGQSGLRKGCVGGGMVDRVGGVVINGRTQFQYEEQVDFHTNLYDKILRMPRDPWPTMIEYYWTRAP